jgi:hypothetical protein
MAKRHNRRWKAEEPIPAPGKRAEETETETQTQTQPEGKAGTLGMKADTTK